MPLFDIPTFSVSHILVFERREAPDGYIMGKVRPVLKPEEIGSKNSIFGEKTGSENIVKEIKQYQEKWLQHIQRMDTNRIPKQALQLKPKDEDT